MTTTDPMTAEERQGLTIWGETISAQVRDNGAIVLHHMDGAPTAESADLFAIPADDVAKLRALLDEAANR